MIQTTAVVVGAGHAGLAMSRRLTERSIDHVVLERGEVANSWRTERWPTLRLLTPNWQTRLPGYDYRGPEPDGYMRAGDVADVIGAYAAAAGAPVQTNTIRALSADVLGRVRGRHGPGHVAGTDRGARHRRVQRAVGPRVRGGHPERCRGAHADGLPGRGRPPRRWRARRRCVRHRGPTRRRDPPLGTAGDDRRGGARPDAAAVPRARHLLVDGGGRPPRRALRR